jgi:hypothetical protein
MSKQEQINKEQILNLMLNRLESSNKNKKEIIYNRLVNEKSKKIMLDGKYYQI